MCSLCSHTTITYRASYTRAEVRAHLSAIRASLRPRYRVSALSPLAIILFHHRAPIALAN